MFKSKSSILSIHYENNIEVILGEEVQKYSSPESFSADLDSRKNKYAIKNVRVSLPDIDGKDELEEIFKEEKKYNQFIYLTIPGVADFSNAKIAVNGRPINSSETILKEQDIIVLKREINVTKNINEIKNDELENELEKNTNSVWNNFEVQPQELVANPELEKVPLFDDFGNEIENEYLKPGEKFQVHLKRINNLERVEYYKIYEKRYIRVEDSFLTDISNEDKIQENPYDENVIDDSANLDNYEEVAPFEVVFNNEYIQLFYNAKGQELRDDFPINGNTYRVIGILHEIVDFYKIEDNKYILAQDTLMPEPLNVNEVKEETDEYEQEETISEENPETVEEIKDELKEIDNPTKMTEYRENKDEKMNSVLVEYTSEMEKVDAFAVNKAFKIEFDEKEREINGIVVVSGNKKNRLKLFNDYRSEKRKPLKENVKGGTYWYTSNVGNDKNGNKYYKIAYKTWISDRDVQFFDKDRID